MSIYISLYSSV